MSVFSRRFKRSPRLYAIWQTLKRTELVRLLRRPGTSRRALEKHARVALRDDRSHAEEASHLQDVLSRCALGSGFVVDLAAGDGVDHSSTLFLFRDAGWRGLAIEMDARLHARLEFAYRPFPNALVLQHKVTPEDVENVLLSNDVPPDFDVLNLDIDSYDLWVAEALLRTFRPSVISMEINEKIPPPVYFAVLYDPEHVWSEDHFYGCSIVAAAELLKAKGYVLESVQYNNAFFIREDVAAGRFVDLSAADAYEVGYRSRHDRVELFPWNHDMEDLQHLQPPEVVRRLHKRFRKYSGSYIAEVRPGNIS